MIVDDQKILLQNQICILDEFYFLVKKNPIKLGFINAIRL